MKNQFIGEQLLKSVNGTTVIFDDWTITEYKSERQLSYLISNEPRDATQLQNAIVREVAGDLMDIIFWNHDVRKWDIDPIIQTFIGSYDKHFMEWIGKKLGTYKDGRPYQFCIEDVRLSDLD